MNDEPPRMSPINNINNENDIDMDVEPPQLESQSHKQKIEESIELAKSCYNNFDIDSAINHLSFAAEYSTKIYGETSIECIEPLFLYGTALLGRALYNDENMSTMPREQAMWFEAVTGYPMPNKSSKPKDLSLFDPPSEMKKLSLPSGQTIAKDIDLSIDILNDVAKLCEDHDELLKAVILRSLIVAETMKETNRNNSNDAKANLKRVFEREFELPDYVKKPRYDLA